MKAEDLMIGEQINKTIVKLLLYGVFKFILNNFCIFEIWP